MSYYNYGMVSPTFSQDVGAGFAGLASGLLGIYQLLGNGTGSLPGTLNQSVNLADPFNKDYATYAGLLQPQISAIQGQQGATNTALTGQANAANAAGQGALNAAGGYAGAAAGAGAQGAGVANNYANMLQALGGTGPNFATNAGTVPTSVTQSGTNLNNSLNALSANYMSNPAIQAQYQLGLQSVQSGLAAQGLSNSGAAQTELEQYGQQYASNAYNQQFNNLLNQSNAVYGQNTGATQLGAALQGQTFQQQLAQEMQQFSQPLTATQAAAQTALAGQGLNLQGVGLEGQLGLQGQGLNLQSLGLGGNLLAQNSNLQLNSMQGLLNALLPLSGATTGSPQTAGVIASQQFGNTQQAAQNTASGLSGVTSSLTNLFNGLLGGFFGGGGGSMGLGSFTDSAGGFASAFGNGINLGSAGDIGSGFSTLFGAGGDTGALSGAGDFLSYLGG